MKSRFSNIFIALSLGVAALTSCSEKISSGEPSKDGKMSFNATINAITSPTKTYLGGAGDTKAPIILWENGDKVKINNVECTVTSADGEKAKIEGENVTANETGKKYIAYYPSSVYDGSTYTFPTSQTYESEKLSNIPLKAESDDNNLTFTCPCAVLEIAVSAGNAIGIVKAIRVSSSSSAIATLSCGSGVSVKDEDKSFYIAVPAEVEYSGFKIELSADGTNYTAAVATSRKSSNTFTAQTLYPMTFKADSPKFSVSSTKQVFFSKGNLYYAGKKEDKEQFYFEEDQYSYATAWSDSDPHVSHFYWSGDAAVAYVKDYPTDYPETGSVFFTNATAETPNGKVTVDAVGVWRTLSNSEWDYLLNQRTGVTVGGQSGVRYAYVTVNKGIYGILIFPDYFSWPADVETKPTKFNQPYEGVIECDGTISPMLKAAGCAFLPAAGYRDGSTFYSDNSVGYYWASDKPSGSSAYSVVFNSSGVSIGTTTNLSKGCAVRLVKDAI